MITYKNISFTCQLYLSKLDKKESLLPTGCHGFAWCFLNLSLHEII